MRMLTLDTWHETGKHFDYRGYDVFYQEAGEGDVLILSHGFPTASWDWYRIWPGLMERFHCIACDYLGFGFSAKPRGHEYTIKEQTDMYEALLQSLGINTVHVLAHDYGDSIAQELIARQEEGRNTIEIQTVCYLNGGLFMSAAHPRPIQKLLKSPLGKIFQHLMRESRFHKSFAEIFGPETQPTAEELHDFWRLISYNRGTGVMHDVIQYIEERYQEEDRWTAHMAATAVPQRFIVGPLDPVSGANMAAAYRDRIPNADVVDLPGIGHYPQVESPDAVLRAYYEFLESAQGVAT